MKGSFSKKATAALLAAALVASTAPMPAQATESYARNITIQVDGRTIPQTDQKAFIKDSRTMVPLRTVMEGLNMAVEWNNEKRSITVKNPAKDETYTFYADKPYFLRYKKAGTDFIKLDVAPYITSSNRTVMPLRAIGETYGKVDWDNANSIVKITGNATAPNQPSAPTVTPNNPSQPAVTPQQPSSEVNAPSQPNTHPVQKSALASEELAWLKDRAKSGPQTEEDLARYEEFRTRKGLSSEEIDLLNAFWRYVPEFKKSLYYKALEAPRKPFTADQLRMLELVNAARAEHGLQPVKLSPALCEGAEIRAREFNQSQKEYGVIDYESHMNALANGWKPHTRPDGSKPKTIINDIGLSQFSNYANMNENLYALPLNIANADSAMDGWLKSSEHKKNILNPNSKYLGTASISSGFRDTMGYVQLFAS
ncbi:stalk domain-containing protein [Peptococcus niger]|uniref:Cysteine-rich secretory protein family protein n=1 Tax=Peptococcus niger TaxID=2741 RepID=A0A1G6W1D5_PEPNI|nr:stalk domain-containing protein [Peptococcus niger]SDD58845.1 Cysteine-rich secretory protein family protein [Peptococcus niger]